MNVRTPFLIQILTNYVRIKSDLEHLNTRLTLSVNFEIYY